jgi:hypothetical protein
MPTVSDVRNALIPRAPDGEVLIEYSYALAVGGPGEVRELATVAPWLIAVHSRDGRAVGPPAPRASVAGGVSSNGGFVTVSLRMDRRSRQLDEEFPPAVLERVVRVER